MELQFIKNDLNCMNRVLWEIKNQEQTLEMKLSEAMPDVGKVLGAWGQPMIRSKEWRGSSMGITGGVQAWVLYMPEDGSEVRRVEGWIPFQMRWEFPQTQRDGTMRISCNLQGMDARIISARKLMVRCVVSALAEALEPGHKDFYTPENVPEDVQLLRRTYPVCIPSEAGERGVEFDDELHLSAAAGCKLLFCTAQPELVDKKIMGDKVIFRGTLLLHGMLQCDDGSLKPFDQEVDFSQYGELEREYDDRAAVDVMLTLTDLETELEEGGRLRLKAGIAGQYVVYGMPLLEVVEDAYSTQRDIQLQRQNLELPAVLEIRQETVRAEQPLDLDGYSALDVAFLAGHPIQRNHGTEKELELAGTFQVLTGDVSGPVQSQAIRWETDSTTLAEENVRLLARASVSGKASCENSLARGDLLMDTLTVMETELPMVTGLVLGEKKQPDPQRPSLILCAPGQEGLWALAKRCGSTPEAIQKANGLLEEPEPDRLLLIPVL